MQNVILIVHLILALCLIGVVLLQRSEGGGLGMGGGGGGAMTGRGAASALGRVTWFFAIAFICTSLLLTVIAAQNAEGTSVVDRLGAEPPAAAETETDDTTESALGTDLLPPAPVDAPLAPPRAD
ncbi:preprotein translocase subunit SecG [Rhodovulum iodosum]|uniref:Protein-export membrane protein SecG n=1 Tax=Rhodovulum iodosum TaxID=68291 RepID=A0ABV3XRC3_9RHOB|nr:preprotein translocase subunit SecG [Rhodovulum robiginosum]RSK37943.1 preprotein translocase subunit SecG [Rhodovulum robiginosum]